MKYIIQTVYSVSGSFEKARHMATLAVSTNASSVRKISRSGNSKNIDRINTTKRAIKIATPTRSEDSGTLIFRNCRVLLLFVLRQPATKTLFEFVTALAEWGVCFPVTYKRHMPGGAVRKKPAMCGLYRVSAWEPMYYSPKRVSNT